MHPRDIANSKEGKRNPIKSREPITDPYPSIRFSQIADSVQKMKCIDEKSALSFLASIQRIRDSSKDSGKEMEVLSEIVNAVESNTDQNARFYIRFYNTLFENRKFNLSWISIEMFETLQDTVDYMETYASGKVVSDSMEILQNVPLGKGLRNLPWAESSGKPDLKSQFQVLLVRGRGQFDADSPFCG
jgi:hypothetical protein